MRNYNLILFYFLLFSNCLVGQNLFDSSNTINYADYLFKGGNYNDAIEEYERLNFMFKVDEPIKLRLVQSYRLAGQPDVALLKIKTLWNNPTLTSGIVSREYFNLMIINKKFDSIEIKISNNQFLSGYDKLFYRSTSFLINENFQNANELLKGENTDQYLSLQTYYQISNDALNQKYKSPILSGSLSAVIPGLGKFYTGNWQDGLISLTIVGSSAWQAYRGFNKHGIKSAYGWIFSFLGTGFYFGNIYGSIKAANKYNKDKKDKLRLRVETVFFNNI